MRGKNTLGWEKKRITCHNLYAPPYRGTCSIYFKKYVFSILKLRYSEKNIDKLVKKHMESYTDEIVGYNDFYILKFNDFFIDIVGTSFRENNANKNRFTIESYVKIISNNDLLFKGYWIFNGICFKKKERNK